MRISLQATFVIGIIFASVCLGVAIKGFTSLDGITDATTLADARGFAWFYVFLATVAAVFSAISAWLLRTNK